jgi:hypothetical protein
MRDIGPFKNHRFRCKLVQIRRVNFRASVMSERIRALLVGKKQNQVWLSLCGHEFCQRTKSGLTTDCNDVGQFASPFSRERVRVRCSFLNTLQLESARLNRLHFKGKRVYAI